MELLIYFYWFYVSMVFLTCGIIWVEKGFWVILNIVEYQGCFEDIVETFIVAF